MNKVPMTRAGYAMLEGELKRRVQIERPHSIERIQTTIADDTNLAENTEYQSAKAEQAANEARIAELEDKLARAEVIDVAKLSGDTIKFGARVLLRDEDTEENKRWQIVGEAEADATKGKISIMSPVARALIGTTQLSSRFRAGSKLTGCKKLSGEPETGLEEKSHQPVSRMRIAQIAPLGESIPPKTLWHRASDRLADRRVSSADRPLRESEMPQLKVSTMCFGRVGTNPPLVEAR